MIDTLIVSVHRFKVHRSRLPLLIGICDIDRPAIYDRDPSYLTVPDWSFFALELYKLWFRLDLNLNL
ncbi:hypothetical protein D1AOALGA4SA_9881 [Olavius algarvensis Delta 1 endosymbiont]|nr:hypothetical protein D1AOALGA4SA_9881 [Olavius algarvensis Delta 1 endosymbiont]